MSRPQITRTKERKKSYKVYGSKETKTAKLVRLKDELKLAELDLVAVTRNINYIKELIEKEENKP